LPYNTQKPRRAALGEAPPGQAVESESRFCVTLLFLIAIFGDVKQGKAAASREQVPPRTAAV
jgi:hypothetical protein